MDNTLHLRIPAGDGMLELGAAVVETKESLHTGKILRQLTSEITVSADEARVIRELLETPVLVDENNGDAWSGHLQSESYRDVRGSHHLTIIWDERENLVADIVEFEGLMLRPINYEEHTEETGIAISLRARLTEGETGVLRNLQLRGREGDSVYFPVIRRGVSDKQRQMRFGLVLWQALDDDTIEHKITLVDAALDDEPKSYIKTLTGEPAVGRLLNAVEQLAAERDAVLDVLLDNGLIDQDGRERIRKAGADAIGTRRYCFYKVADLSEWD